MRRFLATLIIFTASLSAFAQTATNFSATVPAVSASVIQLQGSVPGGNVISFQAAGFGCTGCTAPTHGTILSLNTATGVLVYQPTAGYVGSDSLTFKVGATPTGGGSTTLSSTATLTITITNAKTRVIDTLTNPDGSPRRGKVTFILTQPATGPAGLIAASSSVSAELTAGGQFDLQVYPSTSLSPQSYYQVWFADSATLKRELIGVYSIPASTITITLAANKVTDTNLAARYTFADEASVKALRDVTAAQSLAAITGTTANKLPKVDQTGKLADSGVSDTGTEVAISKKTTIGGDASIAGTVSANNYAGIQDQHLPGTMNNKVLVNPTMSNPNIVSPTINNPVITGQVQGNATVQGTVTAQAFVGSCAGCTGGGATGAVINPGSTTVGADSDVDSVGVVDLQTRGVTRLRAENNGGVTVFDAPTADNQAARRYEVEAEGEEIRSSRFSTLAAAAAAIGSTETTLLLNKTLNCNSAVTWPASSVIRVTGRGRIQWQSGCTINFKGRGIEADARRWVFKDFPPGAAYWDDEYPPFVSPYWWGAKGDGIQDDLPAMRASVEGLNATIPNTDTTKVRRGTTILLPKPKVEFKLSDTWHVIRPVNLEGDGYTGWYPTTWFRQPQGKTAILLHGHGVGSVAPYVGQPMSAAFSSVRNIGILGTPKDLPSAPLTPDMQVNVSGLTLTKVSGAADFSTASGVRQGYGVRINHFSYLINDPTSATSVTILKPRLNAQIVPGTATLRGANYIAPPRTITTGGVETQTSDWVGQQIDVNGQMLTINSYTYTPGSGITFTLSGNYTGTTNYPGADCATGVACWAGTVEIQSLATLGNQPLYLLNAHAIDTKTQVEVQGFYATGISGNSINGDSSLSLPSTQGEILNTNNTSVYRAMLVASQGSGIFPTGIDSQVWKVGNVDVTTQQLVGALDNGFLGNTIEGHFALSYYAQVATTTPLANQNNSNLYPGVYSESGGTGNVTSQHSLTIGGTHGSGFAHDNRGAIIKGAGGWFATTPLEVRQHGRATNPYVVQIGQTGTTSDTMRLLGFGAVKDPGHLLSGGTANAAGIAYHFNYEDLIKWYALRYKNDPNAHVFGMTTDSHSLGGGKLMVGGPVYFGLSAATRKHAISETQPSSGVHNPGDFTFNASPTLGGNLGWCVTTFGDPGTHSKCGWIYSAVSGSGTHQLGATITSPSTGQCLTWDGTKWVNGSCSGGGSGYNLIQNNASGLTARTTLNFLPGLTATDNSGSTRTDVALDVNALTEETSAASGDFIPVYDVSASAMRKMTRANFTAGLGGGGGSPGGSDTQIQINQSGSFGGDADLTFEGGNTLVVGGGIKLLTSGTGNGLTTTFSDIRSAATSGGNLFFNAPNGASIYFNYDHGSGGTFWGGGNSTVYAAMSQTGNFTLNSSSKHCFNSANSLGSGSADACFERLQAGRIGITDGGGNPRDWSVRQAFVDATMTSAGTTGAQTINKAAGSVNFAASATSLVVTNSLVTANSIVICTVQANDSTAAIKNCVPAAGSFTINLSAAATAETKVAFLVINQ